MVDDTNNQSGLYDISIAISNAIRKFGQDLQICIPVIVTKDYDPKADLVSVVPLVKRAFRIDGGVTYKECEEFTVAVKRFGMGNFMCVFPIKEGMTGWVFSSDRDTFGIKEDNTYIDIKENKGPQQVRTFDMGKYTQGFFVPDRWITEKMPELRLGHVFDDEDKEDFSDCLGINLLNKDNKRVGLYLSDKGKVTLINESAKISLDVSSSKDGGKVLIKKDDKTIEIDINNLPDGEHISIAPMWFPVDITNKQVRYEKHNVIVGSEVIGSIVDIDMTDESQAEENQSSWDAILNPYWESILTLTGH